MAKTIKDLEKELEQAKKLIVSIGKQNDNRRDLLEELEPALATANANVQHYQNLANELNNASKELYGQISSLKTDLEKALADRDRFAKELTNSFIVNDKLTRDYDYEKKRRISAENKAFDLETRLHHTVQSEYPASDVQSYMDGLRIDRNGEIA